MEQKPNPPYLRPSWACLQACRVSSISSKHKQQSCLSSNLTNASNNAEVGGIERARCASLQKEAHDLRRATAEGHIAHTEEIVSG